MADNYPRFSMGHEHYALWNFENLIKEFESPSEKTRELMDSAEKNGIWIPQNVYDFVWLHNKLSLDADELEPVETSFHREKDNLYVILSLFKESHQLHRLDLKNKLLATSTYTCSDVKNADKVYEYLEKAYGKPIWKRNLPAIVNLEISKKQEKVCSSIEESISFIHPHQEERAAIACVFYHPIPGIMDKENKLEPILTKIFTKGDPEPLTEGIHRFKDQGYSYTHISADEGNDSKNSDVEIGLHTFNEDYLDAIHFSVYGPPKRTIPMLKEVEKRIGTSETKNVLRLIAQPF
ncbi:hypothetical protein JXB27_03030 [Candidatus Woesearchaeota archaeon]|nr:hypothetical protein [Candidatus Woesearchaeota archaeon]